MTVRGRQAFVTFAVAMVVASVLGGLLLVGSPGNARERRLDARRIADIRDIANAVDLYWARQGRLPASLDELSQEHGINRVNPLDPETERPYGYRVVEKNIYELCAQFKTKDAKGTQVPIGDFWAHGSGAQCFRLKPDEPPQLTRPPETWIYKSALDEEADIGIAAAQGRLLAGYCHSDFGLILAWPAAGFTSLSAHSLEKP